MYSNLDLYSVLRVLIIPWSIGCTIEVTLGGKNTTFVQRKVLSTLWAGALSSRRTTFYLCLLATWVSNHLRYWLKFSPVIHALVFHDHLQYRSTLKPLKDLGDLFFPIIHNLGLSLPVRLEQTAKVILCFCFLTPLTSLPS